jgi:hypothetical protein
MNTHQHVLPTNTIAIPNVFVLGTQAMNHSIGHTTILVIYKTTWLQLVTSIVLGKTNMLPISTYLMWYNVIPPFVLLNLSLYLAYPAGTKGLDYLIFINYTCYVPRNVYLVPEQLVVPQTYTPYSIGN